MKIAKTIQKTLPFSLLVLLSILQSCSGLSPDYYADNEPEMVMEDFFDGDLVAHGIVKDWRGRVIRRFTADILAYWNDGIGVLEEDFVFDDGELQRRVWEIRDLGNGLYSGTAADVVGLGDIEVAGNSTFLNYVLRIPYGDGTIDVRVDDRMYLVSESTLINESILTKFGISVGTILLVIERR